MVAVTSMCIATTGIVSANVLLTAMIGEINRKRTDGNLVSYLGFTPSKVQSVFAEYRRSYPGGRLHVYALIAFGIAVVALFAAAVSLHIIG